MVISNVAQMVTTFLVAIMLVCVITSVITEVTKNTKYLNKIPTELEVIILNIFFSVVGIFVLASIFSFNILWYYVVAAIIIGFFASYVTMFGWESFITIINKFKVPSELREVYKLTSDEKNELKKILKTSEDKVEDIDE